MLGNETLPDPDGLHHDANSVRVSGLHRSRWSETHVFLNPGNGRLLFTGSRTVKTSEREANFQPLPGHTVRILWNVLHREAHSGAQVQSEAGRRLDF